MLVRFQQLEVWGERVGVPVVSGREGGDHHLLYLMRLRKLKKKTSITY